MGSRENGGYFLVRIGATGRAGVLPLIRGIACGYTGVLEGVAGTVVLRTTW